MITIGLSHFGKGLWDPLSMQLSRVRGSQEARGFIQNDDCKEIGHQWLHLQVNFHEKFWTPGLINFVMQLY